MPIENVEDYSVLWSLTGWYIMIFSGKTDPEDQAQVVDDDDEIEESETVTERILGWLWFFFKLGFFVSIVSIIVATGAIIGVLKGFSERVPIISDNSYRPNLTTQVFDCNGKRIALLHAEENRIRILSSKEIPTIMKHAVVAIEDERFYKHYGIDIVGIARAMVKNIKAGRIVQGASTLTQQLVKNAFLTNEKTFKRKAIEAMMAFQVERKYSKDEILTLYLNEIYFGHGAYGLESAAEIYFNKHAKDLTLAECSMLASIPKSPVAYSPFRNLKNNTKRRGLVLQKMVELGFITPAQYDEAKKEQPKLSKLSNQEPKAPYFVTYVRDILLKKYGANLVYNGGLKVYTTLDLEMQKYAEDAMASAPIFLSHPEDKYPGLNGSLISLEPNTGYIKAMYGGRDFKRSQFNRATQALRQPGSSFKPFVYGCALNSGMLPNDTIVDEFISYTNPWTKQVWAPKNYDHKYHGTVTLINALCHSINIPAVKLIDKLTPAKVIRFARKLGITAQMEPNLSLALGSGQFTPLEMASAYGVFANLGVYCPPIAITKVEDRDGNILEEKLPKAREVMKPAAAAMICSMLRTVVNHGTGHRARIKGRAVGGKTGTTNNYVDAWFNGISPHLATVVQFGYDMPKTLGRHAAGGVVAAPPWKLFMEKALKKYPAKDFPIPEGCVRCKVCMVSGKLASKNCPWREVTTQVFPIESQPLTECNHYVEVAKRAPVKTGTINENSIASAQGDNFMPAPGFFRGSYGNATTNTTPNSPGITVVNPPVVTTQKTGWVHRDEKSSEDYLKKWGATRDIPLDAYLDTPTSNRTEQHEPGVVVDPPKIKFNNNYH